VGEVVLSRPPKVAVLYHYFHPDDVVSARHFGDFAVDLAARGWQVEALPCNRGCRDEQQQYPTKEEWNGVHIRRVWRPGFKQASGRGRIANALWMIGAWSRLAFRRGKDAPDVVVVGTDPVLSVLVAPIIKRFNRRVKIAHWAYDLYPEAPIAEGMLRPDIRFTRFLYRRLRKAYQACDLIADLGPCMRRLLDEYGHQAKRLTLVPWALSEPAQPERPDPAVRRELFGDAKLALLYSGNFGRAHSYEEFIALARKLRNSGIHFCFAVRGNRADELRQAVTADDTNVSFAGFAAEEELAKRLAAADIHLASLRPNWTGVVVPSKFFGSLAAGRPVLFAGDSHSGLAEWIRQYQVGWELHPENLGTTVESLNQLAARPESLHELHRHCHAIYHQHFARKRIMDQWDHALRGLISSRTDFKSGLRLGVTFFMTSSGLFG
jgi:glycosyltransferase involved in cell wall biosynthesis